LLNRIPGGISVSYSLAHSQLLWDVSFSHNTYTSSLKDTQTEKRHYHDNSRSFIGSQLRNEM